MKFKIKIGRTFTVIYSAVLLIAFIWGMVTVNVNCYNSMNAEPMVVFEMNGDGIVIMNHKLSL